MSHEVRTPINAMQGMMDLLAHTTLDPRQQHYLVNAQSASSTLLHLVDELLDLSKIEAGKMIVRQEPVNLPIIINKALKLNIGNVDHQRVKVIVDISPDVPSNVICDEMRLIQVLANLLNNAIKFTEQGQISLLIDAPLIKDNVAKVRFRVIDTGIGIASDNQGHLFTAFSQADESMTRKYGGSGLGLSICQQIIKLLGGEINLTSQLGQGSELSFVLPLQLVLPSEQPASDSRLVNLPAELAKPLVTNVTIYAINQELSISFINSITKMGWVLHDIPNVEALCQIEVVANSVLLIEEADFVKQQHHNGSMMPLAEFTLLCLCQPALSNKTSIDLAKLPSTYLLIDKPLFRYTLDQISQALVNKDETVNEMTPQKNSLIGSTDNTRYQEKLTDKIAVKSDNILLLNSNEENLQGVTVLLVEDNLVNQLVAKELLLNLQAKVSIADNGQSALAILAEQQFDVVLMDIQMPIMDGLSATKKIRAQSQYQDLPIIAMTAHARDEDKQQSLAAGMNLHIPKPITKQLLLSSIKQVINKAAV